MVLYYARNFISIFIYQLSTYIYINVHLDNAYTDLETTEPIRTRFRTHVLETLFFLYLCF